MEFKTQYDARDRVFTDPGSPEHITYAGHYDEKGRVVLEESGRENLYAYIQSYAESCDIHVLMKRYDNGDVDALSQKQSLHTDNLGRIYAERIAGKHFFEEKRDYITGVKRSLEGCGAVKARAGDVYMGRQTKMGFGVSVHSFVSSLVST